MRVNDISKKTLAIALPVVIVVGVLVYFAISGAKTTVPANFTAARKSAAGVSQDIVTLTNTVNQKIESANAAEAKGDVNAVLSAIGDARAANSAAYEKAISLAQDLQQMTQSLTDISSSQSRQLAYEAVATELSLVSEFIAYTGSLNNFLNTLASSVAGSGSGSAAVANALKVVNDKAAAIDKLNQEFNQKMTSFDASVK